MASWSHDFRDTKCVFGPAWISDVAYSPADPDVLAAGTQPWWGGGTHHPGLGVLRSVDGGQTWHGYGRDLPVTDVRAIAFQPEGHHLYAMTMFGGGYRIRI